MCIIGQIVAWRRSDTGAVIGIFALYNARKGERFQGTPEGGL
jgi:hypothetical protein